MLVIVYFASLYFHPIILVINCLVFSGFFCLRKVCCHLLTTDKLTEHPELYKDKSSQDNGGVPKQNDTGTDTAGQRQAATDEFMLERFRKRERHRGMRR